MEQEVEKNKEKEEKKERFYDEEMVSTKCALLTQDQFWEEIWKTVSLGEQQPGFHLSATAAMYERLQLVKSRYFAATRGKSSKECLDAQAKVGHRLVHLDKKSEDKKAKKKRVKRKLSLNDDDSEEVFV